MEKRLTQVLTAELIGTFALIFVGAGAGALGLGGLLGVALAHGLVVVGFAYAFGSISGTHINPAVTLGVWLAGGMRTGRAAAYGITQLLGGVLGALALRYCLGGTATGLGMTRLADGLQAGGTTIQIGIGAGLFIEILLTFFLVNAVLHCALAKRASSHAGLAIGLTLVALILVGGPLTGASLNPARSLGPALAMGDFTHLWLYFLGPFAGAAVAAGLFRGPLADG